MRLAVATLAICCSALAFQAAPRHVSASSTSTRVSAPIFAREGDKDGMSGAVGGAVLGGLLAGPFGAVWGASLGGNFGAQRGAQKAAEAKLEQMGISKEVRVAAAECATDLEEAGSGLASCMEALRSAKAFEAQLESGTEQAYAAAQTALVAGDEAEARACLERRAGLREQLTRAQGERADAFGRVTRMESAVAMLTERSRSIEAAMSRAVAVSAESSSVASMGSAAPLSLEDDDPLLRRFKELERDQ